jgi:adenylate kinase family enzyme
MKIAFIGTHGTGKTTLAHELVSKLKKRGIDAGFISEIARNCPFPLNENTTKKSQIWIILSQIIKELEKEEKYATVISDRSVLDGYCYYVNKFGRSRILEPIVKEHLKTYDYLIRIPIKKEFLKKDKLRSVNKEFQKKVDEKFDFLLKEFKIKHMDLSNKKQGTNEEIIEKILGEL